MRPVRPKIVCGLTFGDEGKGRVVDWLVHDDEPTVIMRFNGGAQAAHHVVTDEGTVHRFSQIGAGSLQKNVTTLLSRYMIVDLEILQAEANQLKEKTGRPICENIIIDPRCQLVTPLQRYMGRLREHLRKDKRHGSCGMGIGEAVQDGERGEGVRVQDVLRGTRHLYRKLHQLQEQKLAEADRITEEKSDNELRALRGIDLEVLVYRYKFMLERCSIEEDTQVIHREQNRSNLVAEGAQGALLDRTRGFVPYVTKSNTTHEQASTLFKEARISEQPEAIGVFRAYSHRHGAGPFMGENQADWSPVAELHNTENQWQGKFRTSWIDLPAIRHGIKLNQQVDRLILTCFDQLNEKPQIHFCTNYINAAGIVSEIPLELTGKEKTTWLQAIRPKYGIMPGWKSITGQEKYRQDFPKEAQNFIEFLESKQGLGQPIQEIGIGPKRSQITTSVA